MASGCAASVPVSSEATPNAAAQASVIRRQLAHSADPTARTAMIHEIHRTALGPSTIARWLDEERDVSTRRALILTLGHFPGERVAAATRERIGRTLLRWYRDDPDPGTHSAIDWLLRHNRRGDRPRDVDWRQRGALEAIDRELSARRAALNGWFVTSEGHTLALVRGPVEFTMGAPAGEPGRVPAPDSPDEPLHRVRIPRSFAIGTKEVTIAQFRRFLDASPEARARHTYSGRPELMAEILARLSPDEDGPQIAVTWYEAAMYCNWLSKQQGIPESEWVYPARLADIKGGMRLPSDYLRRTGYRLPTEAEWELAARAGSTTARFFGADTAYLREYAWHASRPQLRRNDPVDPNDPQRTWPVGQLEPNDLGLFDVYGNVWEWTQNRIDLDLRSDATREDIEDAQLVVDDTTARPRRGGSFPYGAAFMRSANRGTVGARPTTRRDNVGFRIARTVVR